MCFSTVLLLKNCLFKMCKLELIFELLETHMIYLYFVMRTLQNLLKRAWILSSPFLS